MPGPIRGLIGLVGKGVAMGAEYRKATKDQKQAPSVNGQAVEPNVIGSSNSSNSRQPEGLPAYSDLPSSTERRLDPGAAATADKEAGVSSEEDLDTDDLYSDTDTDYYSIEDDEELLDLDDALYPADSKDLPTYEESEACYKSVEELVREVVSVNSLQITSTSNGKALLRPQLSHPVILPQRRPRKRARGFIRAYSPVLAECGINQEVFLQFLKNFHKSSQAAPIFSVITISARVDGLAPSVIAMAVCKATQLEAVVRAEARSRARTNNFLDCMNDGLFQPAGLHAMIVKYKSDADMQLSTSGLAGLASLIRADKADISSYQTTKVARYSRTASGDQSMSERMKSLRLASGPTKRAAMLPESAPLIFPYIDKKVAQAGIETFKDKTKDAKELQADYLDRRVQMEYTQQDPNAFLPVPEQHRGLKSAIADPNHPMHSGGLLALVSGGKVAPRADRRQRRLERMLARDERRIARGREPRGRRHLGESYHNELQHRVEATYSRTADNVERPSAGASRDIDAGEGSSRNALQHRAARRGRRDQKGRHSAVKRVMRKDVLYLMIVNMPDEEELAEARIELEKSQIH